jgi:ABC-type transporter Mla subunit MlaD
MRRKRKHPQHVGMSPFRAGLIAVLVISVLTFLAFTKYNPFANPYELTATFANANNLKPNSPVRIAGVQVGSVKKVEPIDGDSGAALVTMEIEDEGLPIHEDARLKVRPRVFLEGNFFVDVQPGSPSSPERESGSDNPIKITQTAAPVQLGDVLSALQSDTRSDLQVILKEYSTGISGKGAEGIKEFLETGGKTFRSTALVNDATLGLQPTKDIPRVLKGQQKVFAALNSNEEALKGLVTNFNITAGALAREDTALEASVPALRDTLNTGRPALAALNSALPSVRQFAVDALPGVKSSGPTLEAANPFIAQANALVGPEELGGTAKALVAALPPLSRLSANLPPFMEESRLLSSCTSNVLVPFGESKIPNPDEPGNTDQPAYRQFNRGLVGLSGESRLSDGNQSYFHVSGVSGVNLGGGGVLTVRPAPPADFGRQPPARQPQVPCETQLPPDLNAPGGLLSNFASRDPKKSQLPKKVSLSDIQKLVPKLKSAARDWKADTRKQQKAYDKRVAKRAEAAK